MEATGTSAAALTTDYLQLFVTQIQNQNPLEPLEQDAFLSQLAQFTMVSGIEEIGSLLAKESPSDQVGKSAELVGKGVTFEDDLTGDEKAGVVDRVFIETDGLFALVNDQVISVSQIESVYQVN